MKSDDIFGFLSQFGVCWSTHCPELRFAQLVALLPKICGRDPFYMANDEVLFAMEEHFSKEK